MSKSSEIEELPRIEYEDIISGIGQLNNDINIKKSNKKGISFEIGDILFGKLRPYLKNWLLADFKGIAVGDWWVLRPNKMDSRFIYNLIQGSKYQNVANLSTGTKMPRSDWKVVSRTKFFVPINKEQEKVGLFFKDIDNLITLHQRKLDRLERLKKAFMQAMFPQKGEVVPKLRFANFDGKWVKRKLGECFRERNERSSEGELISVTINSGVIQTSTLSKKDNSSEDKSNYKRVEVGDIAYNSMRMWQGASGISNYSGIVSPAYTVIIPEDKVSSLFFSYQFKLTKTIQTFQANSQGLTSDTWNLKFPLLKEIKIYVPSFDEQIEIGTFFKQLDTTITFHRTKLVKLIALKKVYLQKMFI